MAFREKTENTEIVVDLTGPEGNAFVLFGYAKRWSEQLNLDYKQIKKEMTAGDYENLLLVLDSYFGDYVIFEC